MEEIRTQKKDLHLAAFRYAVDQLGRDLRRTAEERGLQARLQRDPSQADDDEAGGACTVDRLLGKLEGEVRAVLGDHETAEPERCVPRRTAAR